MVQLSYAAATGPRHDALASPALYACWYDSTEDLWLVGNFEINCRKSEDHGVNFGSEIVAAVLEPAKGWMELDYWAGPNARFARDWGVWVRG